MFHITSELEFENPSIITYRVIVAYEGFANTYNYEEVETYMYHEATYYEEFEVNENEYGTIIYPSQFNFDKISWVLTSEELYHDYSDDMFAIPALRYMLSEFFNPRGIYISGYVSHIDLDKNIVFYYNVEQNTIKYHINKSIDGTDLLKDCKKFKETDTAPSKNFENKLIQFFSSDYMNHTVDYDYVSLFEILVPSI